MSESIEKAKYDSDKKKKIYSLIALQAAVFIHALAGVFSKLASGNLFFSWEYWIPFGLSLCCTFFYALTWQIALKKLSLISAFLGKSVGTIWTAVFGCVIFKEVLTPGKVIGLILVLAGTFLVVTKDE